MIRRIKLRIFVSLLFIGSGATFAAEISEINSADSLFLNQQYTQAFDLYQDLYDQGIASPAMLLKMAFISDASDDYSNALFFLDQYYKLTADREVVVKIEELAAQYDLMGYRYSDTNYFLSLVNKYRLQLSALFGALVLMLFVYIYRKAKLGEAAYVAGVLLLFVAFGLNRLISFELDGHGIIVSDATLLRSGPSAGAEPVVMVSKGHKVKVMKSDEVWTKIAWEGEVVYVRNDKLKLI